MTIYGLWFFEERSSQHREQGFQFLISYVVTQFEALGTLHASGEKMALL
jgi:hypothetical protein